MKPIPACLAMTALQSFSAGDRVCAEHFAAATVLQFNSETGDVTVRLARDSREKIIQARDLIKISCTIGDQVQA